MNLAHFGKEKREEKEDQSENLQRGIEPFLTVGWCSQAGSRAKSQGEGVAGTETPLFPNE